MNVTTKRTPESNANRRPAARRAALALALLAACAGPAAAQQPADEAPSLTMADLQRPQPAVEATFAAETDPAPVAAPEAPASIIRQAQTFFAQLASMENAHDPGLVDLYAYNAVVRVVVRPRVGPAKQMIIPPANLRSVLLPAMENARRIGERSHYSNVRYQEAGRGRVRISASFRLEVTGVTGTVVYVAGPDADGRWVLFEDTSTAHL